MEKIERPPKHRDLLAFPVVPRSDPESLKEKKRTRLIGTSLALAGTAMMLLAALPAVAGTESGRSGAGNPVGDQAREGGSGEAIAGLLGDDEIFGGEGRDALLGGAGDDFIESSGGGRDAVRCGTGLDVVNADGTDLVSADCETVFLD